MSATTIFVGDLSYFCEEKDLLGIFSAFGPVSSVIIRRGKEGNSLQYAFVIMSDVDAHAACSALNGSKFMGRKLRMNISTNQQQRCTPLDRSVWFQLHVRFKINTLSIQLNESLLEEIFMAYGPVADVTVKEYNINMDLHTVSGYAFVYYYTVDAANLAIQEVNQNASFLSDAIHFRCNFAYDVKEGSNKNGFDDFDFPPRSSNHLPYNHHNHQQQHSMRGGHTSNLKSLYPSSLPAVPPRGYFPNSSSASPAAMTAAAYRVEPPFPPSNHLMDPHARRLAGGMMGSYQNSHINHAPYATASFGHHPAQFHQTHSHSSQYANGPSYPSTSRNVGSNSLQTGYDLPLAYGGKQSAGGAASLSMRSSNHLLTPQQHLGNYGLAASSGLRLSANVNTGPSHPLDAQNMNHPLFFSRPSDYLANESDFGSASSVTTPSINTGGSDSGSLSNPLMFATHSVTSYGAEMGSQSQTMYSNINNNPLFGPSSESNNQQTPSLFATNQNNLQNDKQQFQPLSFTSAPISSSPTMTDNKQSPE